ncbi:TrkH family potassium uptake protein [Wenyingzhuangia sp. 2_MG-2023]|uniref:TrkH family potassium uptake protein n=1 Tax=Wenyingzhuangia sp. 2_MG-2023 TaxID=3062639 RepID=UPI0026E38287|nr:potassium transporter TrkG [Wenyingzhuangia sp. 2_MG-2023]MDO6739216.1 potassium transporter TrkG [Wenyingzhuangia sp. 2_MG-2023]MDO6803783.1 potassium transporter TrkG [Wenyingzhuangia sp. 1_MG-2023]
MKSRLLNSINHNLIYRITFLLSLFGLLVFVLDFGFNKSKNLQTTVNLVYFIVLTMGLVATAIRYLKQNKVLKRKVIVFDALSIIVILSIVYLHFFSEQSHEKLSIFYDDIWVKLAIILTFIREFAERKVTYKRTFLNPAQLFIVSFLMLILLGSFLLMLPNATYTHISFLDALFTATSAVCVTGLVVVDTGTFFTQFGQTVIIIMIQIGGLGILTFASYFSYFFKDGSTYENQLVLGDMTNSQKMSEVFNTLKGILFITFIIESLGALLIYTSLDRKLFDSFFEHLFFAAFHSVSAFCNAGFSTLSNSLYETEFRFNYTLQFVIICIFMLGGLGFPIVVNLVKYTKYFFLSRVFRRKRQTAYRPWVLNINSRIALITTTALTIAGTLLFFMNEYHYILSDQKGMVGKFVTSLFAATTPRTSGFNTIDMGALQMSSVLLIILLMWIGASPASTGGGIKTNTFAIAILNFLSLAKGKSRIEIYRREIANVSIRRAFAVISLSLIVIGIGIFAVSEFDPQIKLIDIAFECFSAYSTVGLSLGITSSLSVSSKFVIIVIMFIGRVSMLSIIIAVFKKVKHKNYRYPTEEITIN